MKNMKIFSHKIVLITSILMLCSFVSFIVSANEKKESTEFKIENPAKLNVADKNDEKVVISIINFGRSNPFQRYVEKGKKNNTGEMLEDIPYPPELEGTSDERYSRMVSSRVNGILYDSDSRSTAIVNIDGADYMVHKGDIVNGIVVDNITKDRVTLRYGSNTYSVRVGEIVEGSINSDPVQRNGKAFGENIYMLPDIKLEEANNS